jgi:hypothetical protein
MQVIKFVTKDFKSPGDYEQLDYSKFGIPIEVDVDPKERGQCGKGIHVVPINENADLTNVIFTDTMILLEVAEEDIVYCEKNGKMRVCKATPIRQVVESDKEWGIIRTAACNLAEYAYLYARYVDQKSIEDTMISACHKPEYAYWYAKDVDQKPTEETRTAACKSPYYAYCYALDVDRKPTDETRTAACKSSEFAYWYAKYVDKKPTDETKIAARKDPYFAHEYARNVDKKLVFETRTDVCNYLYYDFMYDNNRQVNELKVLNGSDS